MSEFKLISPLLDQFDMGDPISFHDGVSCCPAMKKETNDKYIVKIIRVPASQTRLDALLLTGAYPDEQSARSYFEDLTKDIAEEVKILQELSALEGFLPYEGMQTVELDNAVGYNVYLLGTYKRTLEKQFVREPLTHLNAVNLGLDLCAALAVCRRAGYLFVDLKPSNIYVTPDREFKIGDLGFVRMNSLAYASLPDKYRSAYTAPEISDAFSSLNTTIDIYSVGLILYQVFNNGLLPEISDKEPLPPPEYADYEMSEIILKACASNPEDRWQDPVEMGQALASYMQRNSVNDTPIIPVPPVAVDEIISAVESITEEPIVEFDESDIDSTLAGVDIEISADDTPDNAIEELSVTEDFDIDADILDDGSDQVSDTDAKISDDNEEDVLAYVEDVLDETDPANCGDEIAYDEVSDELTEILSQVDELTAHVIPEPAVAPEPVEITIPEVETETIEDPVEDEAPIEEIVDDEVSLPENFEPLDSESTVFIADEDEKEPEAQDDENDLPADEPVNVRRKSKGWLIAVIIAVLLLGIAVVGVMYYRHYYLLPVNSIRLEGSENALTVYVDANEDAKLKVVCSDSHGNQITMPLEDGKAVFENLSSNTAYNIKVDVDGFRRLTGNTATAYSTPALTQIVQFTAVTGSEDGSVILNFIVDGPDDGQWSVAYSAPGEAEIMESIPNHQVMLTGLTVGKEYTFRLVSDSDLYVTGTDEITFTANKLVYAENITITSFVDGELTVTWDAPEDAVVDQWIIRCNNDVGYDKTVIHPETSAVFEGLDHNQTYTIVVKAAGMSESADPVCIPKNVSTASNFKTDNSDPNKLLITWDSGPNETSEGWLLQYKVDGYAKEAAIQCEGNSAVINNAVPGALYEFSLQDANTAPVLCEPFSYKMPEASSFSAYSVTAADISSSLYEERTLEHRNAFTPDETIYMLLTLAKRQGSSNDRIVVLYATRDEAGNVINTSSTTLIWNNMWDYYRQCRLIIPYTPADAGNYHICVYFNGQLVADQPYTIENAAD